jgi:ribA/ribD-fused uncharacterized protein
MNQKPIVCFEGEYGFLSNFYRRYMVVTLFGEQLAVRSVEHGFQASKATKIEDAIAVQHTSTPAQAKRMGRKIMMRSDWERAANERGEPTKVIVMRELLLSKFSDPELRAQLLATGSRHLIEGNTWGDTYWGMCQDERGWRGQNWLGRLLMECRGSYGA